MFKFTLGLVVIAGILYFFTPFGRQWTNSAMSFVNPNGVEQQNLTELGNNLKSITTAVNQSVLSKMSPVQATKLTDLLNTANATLETAKQTAQQGDISATISSLIEKVIPAQASPSPVSCPSP